MKCPRIENCPMYCECHGDIPDSPSWKSVRDELPKYGLHVLARMEHIKSKEIVHAELYHVDEGDCDWRTGDDDTEISYNYNVTHWQPLPSPPEVKE